MKYLIILLLSCFLSPLLAQSTCDDTNAMNYGETGNCIYKIKRLPLRKKVKLQDRVNETSGIISYNNGIWTHNDSGGDPSIYKIDPITGKILQTINITNATNRDWEDITEDDQYIYIGDFGNNAGKTTSFNIYKIKKEAITNDLVVEVEAELITFSYPEQKLTTSQPYDHNFDCEAFFYLNNQLHLFTKNWRNGKTYHYTVAPNATESVYNAQLVDSLNVNGLITAADISENGTVALLGYDRKGKVFIWKCTAYEGMNFLSGKSRRYKLGNSIFKGQSEGLCFIDGEKGMMSSEAFMMNKQKIYRFDLTIKSPKN